VLINKASLPVLKSHIFAYSYEAGEPRDTGFFIQSVIAVSYPSPQLGGWRRSASDRPVPRRKRNPSADSTPKLPVCLHTYLYLAGELLPLASASS